ncbi:MAG: hypothetical protein NTU83_05200 [Candidatus Hydrogenedentes bacterium]|nr:hypothetical protein [Candidatus Hydrogenedentota bacterium]
MDRLRVPLTAVAPSGAFVDVVVTGADLQPEGVEGLPVGPIAVNGVVSEAGREYLFIGTVFPALNDKSLCLTVVDVIFHLRG